MVMKRMACTAPAGGRSMRRFGSQKSGTTASWPAAENGPAATGAVGRGWRGGRLHGGRRLSAAGGGSGAGSKAPGGTMVIGVSCAGASSRPPPRARPAQPPQPGRYDAKSQKNTWGSGLQRQIEASRLARFLLTIARAGFAARLPMCGARGQLGMQEPGDRPVASAHAGDHADGAYAAAGTTAGAVLSRRRSGSTPARPSTWRRSGAARSPSRRARRACLRGARRRDAARHRPLAGALPGRPRSASASPRRRRSAPRSSAPARRASPSTPSTGWRSSIRTCRRAASSPAARSSPVSVSPPPSRFAFIFAVPVPTVIALNLIGAFFFFGVSVLRFVAAGFVARARRSAT